MLKRLRVNIEWEIQGRMFDEKASLHWRLQILCRCVREWKVKHRMIMERRFQLMLRVYLQKWRQNKELKCYMQRNKEVKILSLNIIL